MVCPILGARGAGGAWAGIDSQPLTFQLYDALTGGDQVGSDIAVSVDADDGYASATLSGWANHIATRDGGLWLEIWAGATKLEPRQPLNGTPYAVVASRVLVVDTAASGTCGQTGAIRYDTAIGGLRVCDGDDWQVVGDPNPGVDQSNPGATCKNLKDRGVTASGVYWIDPNGGTTSDARQVYCDMVTDGGGWSVCLRADYNTSSPRFDGSIFRETFGAPGTPPSAFGANCHGFITALTPGTEFDFLAQVETQEPGKWQWLGPIRKQDWLYSYDVTSCTSNPDPTGNVLTQCKGSATTSVVDVSGIGARSGWHGATGGDGCDGPSVNQYAAITNGNVLMELDLGYNYGHGTYLHFDCAAAVSHPCNAGATQGGATGVDGTWTHNLLVGQPGAPGPDCGPYQATNPGVNGNRPVISYGFRERG